MYRQVYFGMDKRISEIDTSVLIFIYLRFQTVNLIIHFKIFYYEKRRVFKLVIRM